MPKAPTGSCRGFSETGIYHKLFKYPEYRARACKGRPKIGALDQKRRQLIDRYAGDQMTTDEYIAANRALDDAGGHGAKTTRSAPLSRRWAMSSCARRSAGPMQAAAERSGPSCSPNGGSDYFKPWPR
jgi:hypothetical protein